MDNDYYFKLYENNKEFRAYINRFMRNNDITLREALNHKIIQKIADEYVFGGINYRREK